VQCEILQGNLLGDYQQMKIPHLGLMILPQMAHMIFFVLGSRVLGL
jgi:hypothetical protein